MNNYRQLAPGAYFVAFLLFFIPFFDAALTLAPWHLESSQWRFGAFGLFSNALMLPAAGALIAIATGIAAGQPRALKVFAVLSWIAVAMLLGSTVLFALDATQSRRLIRPEMELSYYVASGTAAGKLFIGVLTFLFLARGSRMERGIFREANTAPMRAFGKRDVASS